MRRRAGCVIKCDSKASSPYLLLTLVHYILSAGQDDLPVLTAPHCGADGKAALLTDWQKSEQLSLVKMLQELSVSGGEELFFMQFPDCLPGRHSAPKADLHHGGASGKPSKTDAKSAQQVSGNCTLCHDAFQ